MEKCTILFKDSKTRIALQKVFNSQKKRPTCIRLECNYFKCRFPNDIIVKYNDSEDVGEEISINNLSLDDDILKKTKNKPMKIFQYNSDGSADFMMLSSNGEQILDKRSENESKRIIELSKTARCPFCDIINNFELYGPSICEQLGISYSFVTYGKFGDVPCVTVLSTEGNIGRIKGMEVKEGIFKNAESNQDILSKIEYIGSIEHNVEIFVPYESPKITFKYNI